jgi:hypothetical protein
MVSAHRKDSIVLYEPKGAHHVGPLVNDIARLVQRILSAHKAKRLYNAFEFVGAPMHITDI